VAKPCDVLLAGGAGYPALLNAAAQLVAQLHPPLSSSPKARRPPVPLSAPSRCLGQLALALDSLRLGLSSDTCVAQLLGACGSGTRTRGRWHSSGITSVAPLAPLAIETLEHLASTARPAESLADAGMPDDATDAAAAAAVRLLAVIEGLPNGAASTAAPALPARTAVVLRGAIAALPLTPRLAFAVLTLVRHCQPRRPAHSWLGSWSSANNGSGALRRALAAQRVPSECVKGAARFLNAEGFGGDAGASGKRSLGEEVAEMANRHLKVAALYEHVEAIIFGVHSSNDASDEMAELRSLRTKCSGQEGGDAQDLEDGDAEDDTSSSHIEGGVDMGSPLPRRSLAVALGSLQRNIRESCIAPYLRH